MDRRELVEEGSDSVGHRQLLRGLQRSGPSGWLSRVQFSSSLKALCVAQCDPWSRLPSSEARGPAYPLESPKTQRFFGEYRGRQPDSRAVGASSVAPVARSTASTRICAD